MTTVHSNPPPGPPGWYATPPCPRQPPPPVQPPTRPGTPASAPAATRGRTGRRRVPSGAVRTPRFSTRAVRTSAGIRARIRSVRPQPGSGRSRSAAWITRGLHGHGAALVAALAFVTTLHGPPNAPPGTTISTTGEARVVDGCCRTPTGAQDRISRLPVGLDPADRIIAGADPVFRRPHNTPSAKPRPPTVHAGVTPWAGFTSTSCPAFVHRSGLRPGPD